MLKCFGLIPSSKVVHKRGLQSAQIWRKFSNRKLYWIWGLHNTQFISEFSCSPPPPLFHPLSHFSFWISDLIKFNIYSLREYCVFSSLLDTLLELFYKAFICKKKNKVKQTWLYYKSHNSKENIYISNLKVVYN